MPKYLIEKQPEGTLSLFEGPLPLQITPPNGPGEYDVHAVSEQTDSVTITTSEAPTNQTPPSLSGSGEIGTLLSATPGVWTGAANISGQWYRGATLIAGATSLSYAPGAADDLAELSYRETAENAIGTVSLSTAAVTVRYAPPQLIAQLDDEIFDQNSGVQLVETIYAFSGPALTFGVTGPGVSIDSNGRLSISTTTAQPGTDVTVVAQNSGGSVQDTFVLTIEEDGSAGSITTFGATDITGANPSATFRFTQGDNVTPVQASVGRFITDEPFVIVDPGVKLGPCLPAYQEVDISTYIASEMDSNHSTAYVAGGSRKMNGMTLDPFDDAIDPPARQYALDDYPAKNSGNFYQDALNVEPGKTGQPLDLVHGQVYMKGVSVEGDPGIFRQNETGTVEQGLANSLRRIETLTALDSAPPIGAFRPPLKGWDGTTWWTDDDFDYTRLYDFGQSFVPTIANSKPTSPLMAPVWVSGGGQYIRSQAPLDQARGYYEAQGQFIGDSMMSLFSSSPLAEKVPVARHLIQSAIDGIYSYPHLAENYRNPGIVTCAALMSFLMVDPVRRAAWDAAIYRDPFVERVRSYEQIRFFYAPQGAVGITPVTAAGSKGGFAIPWQQVYVDDQYPARDSIQETPANFDLTNYAFFSTYDGIGHDAVQSISFALHFMGAVQPDIWDRVGLSALRDEMDRQSYWLQEGFVDGTTVFGDGVNFGGKTPGLDESDHLNFRNYIQSIGTPGGHHVPWTGIPELPFPPQTRYDATAQRITVIRNSWVGAAGSPITQVDLRYAFGTAAIPDVTAEPVSWVEMDDISFDAEGEFVIPADLVEGEIYAIQLRSRNANGAGGWSTNLPFNATNPLQANPLDPDTAGSVTELPRARGYAAEPVPPNYRGGETDLAPVDPNGAVASNQPNLITGAGLDFESLAWRRGGWVIRPGQEGFGQASGQNDQSSLSGQNEVTLLGGSWVPAQQGDRVEVAVEMSFANDNGGYVMVEINEMSGSGAELESTKCFHHFDPVAATGQQARVREVQAEIALRDSPVTIYALDANDASKPPFYTVTQPGTTDLQLRYFKNNIGAIADIQNPQARVLAAVAGDPLTPEYAGELVQNGLNNNTASFDLSGLPLQSGDEVIFFVSGYSSTGGVDFTGSGVTLDLGGIACIRMATNDFGSRNEVGLWRTTKGASDTLTLTFDGDVGDLQIAVMRITQGVNWAASRVAFSDAQGGASYDFRTYIPPKGAFLGFQMARGSTNVDWATDNGTALTELADVVSGQMHMSVARVLGGEFATPERIFSSIIEAPGRGGLTGLVLARQ